jgi:hypothetical protein
MDMQQGNPSGQASNPEQPKNVDEERKKLDEDLKAGKITQAEYFKKTQELTGGAPNNPTPGQPGATPQQMMPGSGTVNPAVPQLPPAGGMPGAGSVKPVSPVSPSAPGPREEVPPIGQALAISSEDVEVVECYKCGGLITITTKQRPVIIACPACGTKGEVDASEPELAPEPAAPKPTDAKEIDEKSMFKFAGEDKSKGPSFGATLDDDLKKQDAKSPAPSPATTPAPQPQAQPQPSVPVKVPVKTPVAAANTTAQKTDETKKTK